MKSTSSAQAVLADPAYHPLKVYLIATTGLAYYADKDTDLAARIALRLEQAQLAGCATYLDFLQNGAAGEAELDELIEELTIGETFFFRHQEMFDALRDIVLPRLIARNQHSRQLRIWSAGCATGAEPYSISILLKRDLAAQLAGWDVTIVGTDINREFLARAREGQFEEWALRGMPQERKQTCFVPRGKSWLIKPEYKEGVSFQYHNLVVHPYPSLLNNLFALDLILCRNVTIYFSLDIIQRILGHFHQCLVEDGWLSVGHAEPNTELFRAFRTVNLAGAVLYQKSSLPTDWHAGLTLPSPAPSWTPPQLPWLISASVETADESAPAAPLPAPGPLMPAAELEAIRTWADQGEWAKAAECCERILARDKLHPAVYFYHALILEQQGRHAEAAHALRRSLYLDRNFVLAHYYLGLLLQKQGNLQQAARAFKNVLQLLAPIPPAQVFADGDGITAAELHKLAHMHLEVLHCP